MPTFRCPLYFPTCTSALGGFIWYQYALTQKAAAEANAKVPAVAKP